VLSLPYQRLRLLPPQLWRKSPGPKELQPTPLSGDLRLTRFRRAASWQACLEMRRSQARSPSV